MPLASRLSGESPWDAVVNHFGLDIVDEAAFHVYCVHLYYDSPRYLPLETLEALYARWNKLVRHNSHYL